MPLTRAAAAGVYSHGENGHGYDRFTDP